MIYLILGKGSYNAIWLGLYSSLSKTLQISEYHVSSVLSWGSCVPLQEPLFDKRTPLRFLCASPRFSVIRLWFPVVCPWFSVVCPWFSDVCPWFSVDRLCALLRFIINKQGHNILRPSCLVRSRPVLPNLDLQSPEVETVLDLVWLEAILVLTRLFWTQQCTSIFDRSRLVQQIRSV